MHFSSYLEEKCVADFCFLKISDGITTNSDQNYLKIIGTKIAI